MLRTFISISVLFLAARHGSVVAQAPSITGAWWRETQFTIQSSSISITYQFAEINLEFDQDIYVPDGMGGRVPVGNMNQSSYGGPTNGGSGYPASLYLLNGMFDVCCGSVCVKRYGLGNGIPNWILTLPSTVEPLWTFFGYLATFNVPSAADNKKLTVAFLLDMPSFPFAPNGLAISGIGATALATCVADGTFRVVYAPSGTTSSSCGPTAAEAAALASASPGWTTPGYFCQVTNAQGQAPTRNQMFTLDASNKRVAPCTPKVADGIRTDLRRILKRMENLQAKQEVDGLEILMAGMETRYAFTSCLNEINSFIQWGTIQKSVANTYDCQYDYTTERTQYDRDPCCAWFRNKCCVPRAITRPFRIMSAIKPNLISNQCGANANRAAAVLEIYRQTVTLFDTSRSSSVNVYDLYSELYQSKLQECQTEVQNEQYQRCQSDLDCWSGKCAQQQAGCSSCQRSCERPPEFVTPLLRCLSAGLSAEVLARFYKAMNVRRGDLAGAKAYLQRRFGEPDCVGPNSWSYKAGRYWVPGPDGNYVEQIRSANVTGCLSEKRCNWAWGLTQAQCENTATVGPNFCAQCNGGWCNERGSIAQCQFGGYQAQSNQALCSAWGGSFVSGQYSQQSCVKGGRITTYGSCADLAICPGPNSPRYGSRISGLAAGSYSYACSSPICYSNENQATCNAASDRYWDTEYANGAGLCVSSPSGLASNYQTDCSSKGMMFFPGVIYRKGQYDTNATCESPKCQVPLDYRLRELSPSQCQQITGCNQPCQACSSYFTDGIRCLTIVASFWDCYRAGGSTGASVANGVECYNKVADQAACTNMNGTAQTCGGLSRAQCSSQPSQLGCYWNTNAPCSSDAACTGGGRGECDDWSINVWDASCPDYSCGACVEPFPVLPNGAIVEDCNLVVGADGYPNNTRASYNQFARRRSRVGCITDKVSDGTPFGSKFNEANRNQTACLAWRPNAQYYQRAKTQAECVGHAVGCLREWGSVSKISVADCTNCRGTPNTPIFTWTTPQVISGVPVYLKYQPRAYASINRIVQNTVPLYRIESFLEEAVTRIVGRRLRTYFASKYLPRLMVFRRLACLCTNLANDPAGAALCAAVNNATARAEVATCTCIDDGSSVTCDATCPYQCGSDCSYKVYNVFGYSVSGARRRLQAGASSNGLPVRNSFGVIIGQTIGTGGQYEGNITLPYELCLKRDALTNVRSEYTVFDFAIGVNSAPGAPQQLSITVRGDQYCAMVSTQQEYFPIARLARWNAADVTAGPTTGPTTGPGGPAQTTAVTARPTTASASRWVARLVVFVSVFVVLFV